MQTRTLLLAISGLLAAGSLAGCESPPLSTAANSASHTSPFPARSCNPALVVNRAVLEPNDDGVGGPAPPGIGAATGPWCKVNAGGGWSP